MRMELWELADKATILQVKRGKGLDVREHYDRYMKATESIPKQLMNELYKVNLVMFDMEDMISQTFELGNYEMAGHLYHVLRGMTHVRTKAKHAVAKWAKEPLEVKKYGRGY